jgi:hypothetical protein
VPNQTPPPKKKKIQNILGLSGAVYNVLRGRGPLVWKENRDRERTNSTKRLSRYRLIDLSIIEILQF